MDDSKMWEIIDTTIVGMRHDNEMIISMNSMDPDGSSVCIKYARIQNNELTEREVCIPKRTLRKLSGLTIGSVITNLIQSFRSD